MNRQEANKQAAKDITLDIIAYMRSTNKLAERFNTINDSYLGWKIWIYQVIVNEDASPSYLAFRLGAKKGGRLLKEGGRFLMCCYPGGDVEYKVGEKFDIELKEGQEYIIANSLYNEFEIFLGLLLRLITFINKLEN